MYFENHDKVISMVPGNSGCQVALLSIGNYRKIKVSHYFQLRPLVTRRQRYFIPLTQQPCKTGLGGLTCTQALLVTEAFEVELKGSLRFTFFQQLATIIFQKNIDSNWLMY